MPSSQGTPRAVASSSQSIPRPVKDTKPCVYFQSARGCYNGQKCRFLHGSTTSPHEESKTCIYFAKGYCSRNESCWFKHVSPTDGQPQASSSSTTTPPPDMPIAPSSNSKEEEITCGICFEKPEMFGLLSGCSHSFCLKCLRDWRGSSKKDPGLVQSNVIKTCPLCRAESNFITPASQFFAQDDPKKPLIIEAYKRSMAKVGCKYFLKSPANKRFCPYGDDCFYKHEDENGQVHKFDSGASTLLPAFKARQERESRRRARQHQRSILNYDSDGRDPFDFLSETIGSMHPEESAELAVALEMIRAGAAPHDAWSAMYDGVDDDDSDYQDAWEGEDHEDHDWGLAAEDLAEAFESAMGF
ncbi:hypothetical protein FRB94_010864 [Tulasnella sp. JGI-2019a]|nr:hypothetical protein FRB93_009683 [Tulasnella sp. JGI-2019a]KAG8993294.1 hypothetical protein FRB94_010864 [Tulasnella sp. JGI-2019a]KAG9032070.1 hypothetical protein FRB95_001931 [Tulasnella sp. JGI-2019a]